MRTNSSLLVGVLLLASCASVTVTPLTSDGTKAEKQAPGLRYYMPRPYLLVAELPPTATAPTAPAPPTPPGAGGHGLPAPQDPNAFTPPAGGGNGGGNSGGDTGAQSAASPSPSSDTGFSAATPQYVMKLIYLPDLAHPMSITARTGAFGATTMKPTLQDGWMLTALDASADSKTAEVLTALGGIVGAVTGAGGSSSKGSTKGAGAPSGGPGGAGGDLRGLYTAETAILKPGLYQFEYDDTGKLTGLSPVTLFSGTGTKPATPPIAPIVTTPPKSVK